MVEPPNENGDTNKLWICNKCMRSFEPSPPSYRCPKCQSNFTIPLTPRNIDSYVQEPEKKCPECQTVMRFGFIVERNTPLTLLTLGEGIYWSPGEAGVIGNRVALKSYACPECGYISLYARRLDQDKSKIMKAPTRPSIHQK